MSHREFWRRKRRRVKFPANNSAEQSSSAPLLGGFLAQPPALDRRAVHLWGVQVVVRDLHGEVLPGLRRLRFSLPLPTLLSAS